MSFTPCLLFSAKEKDWIHNISECVAKTYPGANFFPVFCFLHIESQLKMWVVAQQGPEETFLSSSRVPVHPRMDGDSTCDIIYFEAGSRTLGLWHCLCCTGWQSNLSTWKAYTASTQNVVEHLYSPLNSWQKFQLNQLELHLALPSHYGKGNGLT